MERQFMRINPSQGNNKQEQSGIQPTDNSQAESQPASQPVQPRIKKNVTVHLPPDTAGKGLLSRWKEIPAPQPQVPPGQNQQTLRPEQGRNRVNRPPFENGQMQPQQNKVDPQRIFWENANTQPNPGSRPSPPPQPYTQQPQPISPYPVYMSMGQGQMPELPGVSTSYPPPQQPVQRQPSKKQLKRKKKRMPTWAKAVLLFLLAISITLGGIGGYYYFTLSSSINSIVGQQVNRAKGDVNPNANQNDSGNPLSGGRINILLLGSDSDQKFVDASGKTHFLAQTDIIVTIDPATKSVGMLSIPRDTWLTIPGYGMGKLDEAYGNGGVATSLATIHQDFGIYINYYAWVGLDGFVKVIDTAGGVDVDVLHPIVDDNYPDDVGNTSGDIFAYKRLSIAPGPQHLDGPQALEYVRSRHADLVGDFGRSVRQQQVLSQLKARLNNASIIEKIPEFVNDLKGYVTTDMTLTQIIPILNFARSLDQNKINRVTLGAPYSKIVNNYQRSDGSATDIVVLDCTQVQPLIAKMFDLGDKARCDTGMASSNNSNNSTQVALTAPPSPVANTNILETASSNQLLSQFTSSRLLNINSGDNMLGVHSLLDLLFLVVFESPLALQV